MMNITTVTLRSVNHEQPGLVGDVPAHGRGVWNEMILQVSSNPNPSVIL